MFSPKSMSNLGRLTVVFLFTEYSSCDPYVHVGTVQIFFVSNIFKNIWNPTFKFLRFHSLSLFYFLQCTCHSRLSE